MADDRVGEVGAADRLALGLAPLELGLVELVAELAQGGGHRVGALLPIPAPGPQPLAQHLVVVVDDVAEHVQILLVAVDRRDLDSGDDTNSCVGRRVERLLDAVDRVVVAQREQFDAGLGGGRDDVAGRQCPVRVERVALEVERGGIGAQAPRG